MRHNLKQSEWHSVWSGLKGDLSVEKLSVCDKDRPLGQFFFVIPSLPVPSYLLEELEIRELYPSRLFMCERFRGVPGTSSAALNPS